MNPIVNVVAQALFAAECGTDQPSAWTAASKDRRRHAIERVEDVLLAACNAGYVLIRAPDTRPNVKPEIPAHVLFVKYINGTPHAFTGAAGDRHRYVLADAATIEASTRDTLPPPDATPTDLLPPEPENE